VAWYLVKQRDDIVLCSSVVPVMCITSTSTHFDYVMFGRYNTTVLE
jgi:hypothetical protein